MREVLGSRLLRILVVIGLFAVAGPGLGLAAEKEAAPPLSYDYIEARKSLINPHEQINDEGEILWSRCLICHKTMPDTVNLKAAKNWKLRFADDINKNCYICHIVKKHPGSEGIGVSMSGFAAPSHLVELSRATYLNMRLVKKEVPVLLPLDPATDKIFCGTCHNPHERGVLYGRADWGADQSVLLRSEGGDVCQYCHRK
ncbi:MAG: cytochrome c3 family protein [Thermodesulfobacteriota bacterium]